MEIRNQPPEGTRLDGHTDACAAWALLLPDAADGLLSPAEELALERHMKGCAACSGEFAEAQRGLGWLAMLKSHAPEPPDRLLASILAKTTGAEPLALPQPVAAVGNALGWRHGSAQPAAAARRPQVGERLRSWLGLDPTQWSGPMQPRLAMTGAMAFFSICLTLNLTGFSLGHLRAEGFGRPGLQRSVADAGASAVRSFQGLRVVYRVESRVNQLRAQNDLLPGQDPNR